MVSDDIEEAEDRFFPLIDANGGKGRNPIVLRDASTLNFIRAMPTPMPGNWQVVICGRQGAEIIVTSNFRSVMAFQGNRTQGLEGYNFEGNGNGIPMLGCETHLIVFGGRGEIFVFRAGIDPLLTHCHSVVIPGHFKGCPVCQWTAIINNFSFATENQENNYIHIWSLDETSSQIPSVKEIDAHDLNVQAIAVGERFIAACDGAKKIHVFEFNSGKKLYSSLCDVSEDEELGEDDVIFPVSMEPVGDLLVSTSHVGHALCIWNMKSGHLLKRYTHAFRQNQSDQLPNGVDVSSMIHLKHLPAFVTMSSHAYVWAFPDDSTHSKMISSIKRREKWNLRHSHDAAYGSDSNDGDY